MKKEEEFLEQSEVKQSDRKEGEKQELGACANQLEQSKSKSTQEMRDRRKKNHSVASKSPEWAKQMINFKNIVTNVDGAYLDF